MCTTQHNVIEELVAIRDRHVTPGKPAASLGLSRASKTKPASQRRQKGKQTDPYTPSLLIFCTPRHAISCFLLYPGAETCPTGRIITLDNVPELEMRLIISQGMNGPVMFRFFMP